MKKGILVGLMTSLIIFMIAPVVMADQIRLYQSGYSYGIGGEFTAKIINNGANPDLDSKLALYSSSTKNIGNYDPSFQTFCMEYNEEFNPGSLYNIAISNRAYNGGVGPAGDPLSVGTAWLYQQFAQGILANYHYGAGRQNSAGYLQNIFWYLEDEQNTISIGNPFKAMLINQFGSLNNAKADNNGLFHVAILNLTDSNGGRHQDQLVMVPVPEPSTLLLLGSGLLGLWGFRKKFKK